MPDYLPIQTCQYVEASYVFKDCPLAWDVFSNGEPDCSWGDNNRTLVTPDLIFNLLDERSAENGKRAKAQIKTVLKRLVKLGQTYIDLEN